MGTFTMATGLGMFAFGMIAFAIGATAFFIITRKIEKNKKIYLIISVLELYHPDF